MSSIRLLVENMSERKTHLAYGVLIGFGTMLVLLGFLGWFSANYFFDRLSYILSECGIDINRHYIFHDLSRLRVTYASLVLVGFASLLYGAIRERLLWKKTP